MNVVGYCRLSRDDDAENMSIDEQKRIILNYASDNGLVISRIYIDDNCSGFTVDNDNTSLFDRPEYNEMMEAVKVRKINTIIVKDLSRLGRKMNSLLTAIEIMEKYDCKLIDASKRQEVSTNDDYTGIEAWFYDKYVKDISKKVRQSFFNKQREGRLIMGNYFGYVKQDKTTLVVDETIRPCIELVYRLYIEGNGYYKIASYLNENTNYPTPSLYYARKHSDNGRVYKHKVTERWEGYHIQNILENDVYTGLLRTHKKQTKSIRGYVKKLPESEHFTFEDHHEAIISKADWELVQEIRKNRDKNDYKGSAKNDYVFRGFTVCGECNYHAGAYMLKRKVKVPAYNCSQFTRYGTKGCGNKETKEEDLLNQFKAFLMDTRNAYSDYLSSIDFNNKIKDNPKIIKKLQKELERLEQELKVLINQKIQAIVKEADEYKQIVSDTYNKLEDEKKQRILELKNQIMELEKQTSKEAENTVKSAISVMDEIITSDRPSRKLLEMILDKVILHKDRIIEFKLKVDIGDIY
ncbi:MAG: recombinase family protein [Clostridia bacterium]|nr:recombinase family protein [Clostridia bacterium]